MSSVNLQEIDDSTLLQEAANRLMKRFEEKNGIEMKYGGFNFMIHEGKFIQIEDSLRDRSFFTEDFKISNTKRRRH